MNENAKLKMERQRQREERSRRPDRKGKDDTDLPEDLDGPDRRNNASPDDAPAFVAVKPVAGPATMKRRHYGLVLSFFLMVLVPVLVAGYYMAFVAEDQYASNAGITVRQEETQSATELLGGLAQFMGGGTGGTAELLYEFIQSQVIVEQIEERFGLIEHYSRTWPGDPLYSIWPDATIEELHRFWLRMIKPSFDKNTGLLLLQVRARDPQSAQTIAQLIISESEYMINRLNVTARDDSMRNAQQDLDSALERLRAARAEMTEFRARTQIVDPTADAQGRMGVLNNLQQQLAQALVDNDLLLRNVENPSDPRLRQIQQRIEVIRARIAEERVNFALQDVTVDDTDYPRLIAQFESLR
ncbi:MAG: sugar transporter, partial [Roseinatronobacter sp.]